MDERMNMHFVFIKSNVALYVVAHGGQLSCKKSALSAGRNQTQSNPTPLKCAHGIWCVGIGPTPVPTARTR